MNKTIASIAGAGIVGVFLPLFFIFAQETHVVINEIMVGGEKATDEFVELYNPTDADVALAGWRLSKKTASGSLANLLTEFPSAAIPAHGYILIAHNDYTGAAAKDLAYSTQSSITADNTVILYSDNGQTVVDLVGMGSAGEAEGSAAPSPDPGMSIERNGGIDSQNNASDFVVRTIPTPKQGTVSSNQGSANSAGDPSAPYGASNNQETYNNSSTPQQTSIAINEVLPNPAGNDEGGEWIELVNLGDQEVDLTDWAVEDTSGKHYTIKQGSIIASTTIAPKGYFLLPRSATGIALNNTGTETLTLLNPSEQTTVSASYTGPSDEGYSWARNNNGNFEWTTTPTPSASNVITAPVMQETNKSKNQENNTAQAQQTPLPSLPSFTPFTIVVNELLPNPQGDDTTGEWIEIKNESDDEATLAGLTLTDESGARYIFTTQQNPIPPRGLLMLPRAQTKITLNNDGDTITLSYKEDPLTEARYGKSEEGMSFARDEQGNYAWTTAATPGTANTFSLPAEIEDEEESEETTVNNAQGPVTSEHQDKRIDAPPVSKQTTSSVKIARTASIESLRDLPRETNVSVEGVVIVPPGVFGKTTLYLDGIQVYSVAIKFPDLTLGDRVQVQGYMSASGNETRITVPKTGFVKQLSKGVAPEPLKVTADTVGEPYEGKLVRIEGELMEKKGTTLWFDDDTGEVRIVLKEGTGLASESFVIGQQYAITGVLSETISGYRLLPRSEDDIETQGEVLGATADASSSRQHRNRPLYYIFTALTVLVIAGGLGWRKWHERQPLQPPSPPSLS